MKFVDYLKSILSVFTAIVLAEFVPSFSQAFRSLDEHKATGLAVVGSGFMESLFSPRFWLLVILFFAVFFATGRMGNRLPRILLCVIPTLAISALGFAILSLYIYVLMRS